MLLKNKVSGFTSLLIIVLLFFYGCTKEEPISRLENLKEYQILDSYKTKTKQALGFDVYDNKIYLIDGDESNIKILNADGEYEKTLNFNGALVDPFNLCIYKDKLYIIDNGDKKIKIFSLDQELIGSIGFEEILDEGSYARYIGIDDGTIYLSTDNFLENNARIFASNGGKFTALDYFFHGIIKNIGESLYCVQNMELIKNKDMEGVQSGKNFIFNIRDYSNKTYLDDLYTPLAFTINDKLIYGYGASTQTIDRFDMEGQHIDILKKDKFSDVDENYVFMSFIDKDRLIMNNVAKGEFFLMKID